MVNSALKLESEKLARSWMQHDQAMLRDYLVADVEDPRINVQSMITRHFLISELFGDRFDELAQAELSFGAAMNWLIATARKAGIAEILGDVDYALGRGADQTEGIDLPFFMRKLYASLPCQIGGMTIPNYIREFLQETQFVDQQPVWPPPVLFQNLWAEIAGSPELLTVFEPACGSANDYRFLDRYGIGRWLDYTGLDICEKNIANARELYPSKRFVAGNVFEIPAQDGAFECSFAHDLFEHLSPEGIERAVGELCRVTRRSLCLHFFNMDEIPDDRVQPVQDYHWNCLSAERMCGRFNQRGFDAQLVHIGRFIRVRTGCEQTHNPGAYTLLLRRRPAGLETCDT